MGTLTRPIPHDRNGYSIEVEKAVVHTRYPRHGDVRPRVRSLDGIRTYLGGREAQPCDLCYPPPATPAPVTVAPQLPKRGRATRAHGALEAVGIDEPELQPEAGQGDTVAGPADRDVDRDDDDDDAELDKDEKDDDD
jgi:hypothetical protein